MPRKALILDTRTFKNGGGAHLYLLDTCARNGEAPQP